MCCSGVKPLFAESFECLELVFPWPLGVPTTLRMFVINRQLQVGEALQEGDKLNSVWDVTFLDAEYINEVHINFQGDSLLEGVNVAD